MELLSILSLSLTATFAVFALLTEFRTPDKRINSNAWFVIIGIVFTSSLNITSGMLKQSQSDYEENHRHREMIYETYASNNRIDSRSIEVELDYAVAADTKSDHPEFFSGYWRIFVEIGESRFFSYNYDAQRMTTTLFIDELDMPVSWHWERAVFGEFKGSDSALNPSVINNAEIRIEVRTQRKAPDVEFAILKNKYNHSILEKVSNKKFERNPINFQARLYVNGIYIGKTTGNVLSEHIPDVDAWTTLSDFSPIITCEEIFLTREAFFSNEVAPSRWLTAISWCIAVASMAILALMGLRAALKAWSTNKPI